MQVKEIKESNRDLIDSMLRRRYDLALGLASLRGDYLRTEKKLLDNCEQLDDELHKLLEVLKKKLDLDESWEYAPAKGAFVNTQLAETVAEESSSE